MYTYWVKPEGSTSTYWENMQQTGGVAGGTGEVALYINKTNTGLIDVDSRAFLCCQESKGEFYNLFSILNGGNVYIGGKLLEFVGYNGNHEPQYSSPSDLKQINDRIKVDGAGIEIVTSDIRNGQIGLYMDFSHFYDTVDRGMSLKEFVSKSITQGTSGLVGDHYHIIWAWNFLPKFNLQDPNRPADVDQLMRWFNQYFIPISPDGGRNIGQTEWVEGGV